MFRITVLKSYFLQNILGPNDPNPCDQTYGWWGSVKPLKEFVLSHEPGDIRLKANVLSPLEISGLWVRNKTVPGSHFFTAGDQQFFGTRL